jgi:DNA mismatch endonuclease, patch repair protein
MVKSASNKGKCDVSAIMRKVRSTNTSPEIALRAALEAKGLRLSASGKDLPGKPDIVLPDERIAIFVDGDFWHGGQWRRRKFASLEDQFKEAPSKDYWINKIRRNVDRDFNNTKRLLDEGWKVIRFWESRIRKDLDGCVLTVLEASKKKRKSDIVSIIPGRTLSDFSSAARLTQVAFLESKGWTAVYANDKRSGAIPSVTLAIASFTREDFSSIVSKEGYDARKTSLFNCFIAALTDMKKRRPPILLLQIAAGALSSNKGNDFRQALFALNRLGYTVDAFMLETSSSGNISRKRLFVIAILESCIPAGEVREQTSIYESLTRPEALTGFILRNTEINWNIRTLPIPSRHYLSDSDKINNASPIEWIAEYYLNPLVNELMKGRPLSPYFV